MKIVVCIKQISYTYSRSGMDPVSNFLASEDHVFRVNPYDEIALGMALHIKELVGGGKISLLTLGPLIAEKELRRCLAVGANHLYQIPVSGELDPFSKSVYLARAIQTIGADLVLCGKESLDTKSGQVGAFLAHHLKMPFVSCIREISLSSDNAFVKVQRSAGRGMREVISTPLPAVFSIEGGKYDLPYPAYPKKKISNTLPFCEIIICEKDEIVPKTVRTRIFSPCPRTKKTSVPDSRLDAFHRIQQLQTVSTVEKNGEIIAGDPESQVEAIISFLKKQGFLRSEKSGRRRGIG